MKTKLLTIAALLAASAVYAQTTDLGGPLSWQMPFKSHMKDVVQTHVMPQFDLAKLEAEDAIKDEMKMGPWRFGYNHKVSYSLNNSGTWENLTDGGRVWRIRLSSPGALSMNLLLEDVNFPEGSQLYLFETKGTNRVGAYTHRNNREDGLLGTELVIGDDIIVEFYEPASAIGQGSFTITDVVHGYRSVQIIQDSFLKGLNDSGNCNIDVHCPLGDLWWNQINSIAMIVVGGSGVCTGALINNSCDDGTPYFLTADHCLGPNTGNWAFRFNWQSPEGSESCATTQNSSNSTYDQTSNGATVLVSNSSSDFALLEINNMTEQDAINYGAFYAGWDASDNEESVTKVIGIHHPRGDLKKICYADDGGNGINHQYMWGSDVWYIDAWEEGVTEGGSSGSPLFNQDGQIIGQLYGGLAACSGTQDNGDFDVYGRLGTSWGLGASGYLAPNGCPAGTSNWGYDPNPATANTVVIETIEFSVSPNPSNGLFVVEMSDFENAEILVTDLTGRVVRTVNVLSAQTEIDLAGMANGSYVIRVNGMNGTATQTIILAK